MSAGALLTRGLSSGRVYARMRMRLAAFKLIPEPPSASYPNYGTQTSFYAGIGLSLQQGDIPGVALGDVFLLSNTSPGNHIGDVAGDGTVTFHLGGDSSRQSANYQLYRAASATFDGPGVLWLNATPPIWNAIVSPPALTTGADMPAIDLVAGGYITSPWGDALTFTVNSGALPLGVDLSPDGIISGIPTQSGTFNFTIAATDSANLTALSGPCQLPVTDALVNLPPHPQKFTRHRGKTLVVLPFDEASIDMTPAERAEQLRLDQLRESMQGVFAGDQAAIQAHVDAYRAEQQRIASMSQQEKTVTNLFGKLGIQ